ncbi:glycosyltransferase family A protein [Microbacterium sp. Bi128]|uniref:glycosyltransferase family A protein n=1 Tax=Microbacterium sp. Bi128 TaxID=2821115 RepID=UPI001D7D0735|nr:glycosyltransferase family A protein [Microbacterium sp. Bi128]CAH0131377.1 hypothetical protein SRABI128_00082 [Microbacterium sp. Bi128]
MPSTASDPAARIERLPASRVDSLSALFHHIEDQPGSSRGAHRIADLVGVELAQAAASRTYFLTVVLRTQGHRSETLRDSLLCLAGQSSDDFEVLVMCHHTDEDEQRTVEELVAAQPRSFRERIRVVRVSGGRRARPLNEAVELSRGRYLSFFDDDDLVFGHWVETFARVAEREPGKLIRSVVSSQRARHETWSGGRDGFRHVSWPRAEYPARFDQFAHLRMNFSPFMGWAFPCQLFTVAGLRFDEELYVCEDWDMILRGSLLLGVADAGEMTAIYRRWEGRSSSYTVHDQTQWQASQLRVTAKLDEHIVLGRAGTVAEIISLLDDRDELHRVRGHLDAILRSRGFRYAAPIRFAMRVADFGRRKTQGIRAKVSKRTSP